jgi:hypothetical protein
MQFELTQLIELCAQEQTCSGLTSEPSALSVRLVADFFFLDAPDCFEDGFASTDPLFASPKASLASIFAAASASASAAASSSSGRDRFELLRL